MIRKQIHCNGQRKGLPDFRFVRMAPTVFRSDCEFRKRVTSAGLPALIKCLSVEFASEIFKHIPGTGGVHQMHAVPVFVIEIQHLPKSASAYLSAFAPRRADSIVAMSIFFIFIIASIARFAAARSGSVVASSRARGVICQANPQPSVHQPHWLST